MKTLGQRFWPKVIKSDECWHWGGARYRNGYGRFSFNSKTHGRAHRIAYELAVGKILIGLSVLHRCDNKLCVNPSHLFLGTQKDNMRDASEKGRLRGGAKPGHKPTNAKLTSIQAQAIRAAYAAGGTSQAALGKSYGVSQTQVGKVVRGLVWK